MNVWHVHGGEKLAGSILLPGSSTTASMLLAATLLAGCEAELTNCPDTCEVKNTLSFLRHLKCTVQQAGDVVYADTRPLSASDTPAVFGDIPYPELFRAALAVRRGELCKGGVVCLEESDWISTACAVLTACGAGERTVLLRASKEPEIVELQHYLRLLGVNVTGAGSDLVVVEGFSPVKRVGYRVCPDRGSAAAVMCAGACVGGDIEIRGIHPETLCPVTDILAGMGCETETSGYVIRSRCPRELLGGYTNLSGSYPKLSPELVPFLMAAALKARGRTVFTDQRGRFLGAEGMRRLGGNVDVMGSVAIVNGTRRLSGTALCTDKEAECAVLLVAGLGADGTSDITNISPETGRLDGLCSVLRLLGAIIKKSD